MSENIIAASRSMRRSGCIVTSQANSGVRQTVKKSCFDRTSLNSGKYLKIEENMIRSTGI